jgi:hypothetical protein
MSDTAALAVLTGLAVRLAVPILVTALAVFALRRLDAGWQTEAQKTPLKADKPKCWKTKSCTTAQRKACPAVTSPLACWQVFRLPNGYLREECLACQVFVQAPLPARA